MSKLILTILLAIGLSACTTVQAPHITSELQQGKRDFEAGYYKQAMHRLLPLACDGNAEAQYAIGYMYYYGYGVTQDTDTGTFWIERAARKHYIPAEQALKTMTPPRHH